MFPWQIGQYDHSATAVALLAMNNYDLLSLLDLSALMNLKQLG